MLNCAMPRRSNLSGRLHKSGNYEIRVTLTRTDGAKFRKSVYGKTLEECQYEAHKLIFESNRQVNESLTLDELAELWRKSWKVAEATKHSYEYGLSLILPTLGKKQCSTLTVPVLMAVVLRQATDRKARQAKVVLGTLLNYGVMVGALQQNPLTGLKSGRGYKPKRRRITTDELNEALKGMSQDCKDFFLLLADAGLRPWKEAVNLTREDLGYSSDEYYVKVGDSKTDAGTGRIVPITDADLAYRLMEKAGRLFPSHSTLKRAWTATAPIYALRSYAISRWCEAGLDLDVVKIRAGHSDIRLTLDIYNEVAKERILTGQRGMKGVRVSELTGDLT